jgi:hypothetical protein
LDKKWKSQTKETASNDRPKTPTATETENGTIEILSDSEDEKMEDVVLSTESSVDDSQISAFSMTHKYGPLMFFGFMGAEEAVAVERPVLSVMEALPPGYYRKRYGS